MENCETERFKIIKEKEKVNGGRQTYYCF